MAKIAGNVVSEFADRSAQVSVRLNSSSDAEVENQGKCQPVLLENVYREDGNAYIGNAVICQAGSLITFLVSSDRSICGIEPNIKSNHEMITEGLYWTSDEEYSPVSAWVSKYSNSNRMISTLDWKVFSKNEGFRRSQVSVSVKEVTAFTKQEPGGMLSNIQMGGILGELQLQLFVFKDIADISEAVAHLDGSSVAIDVHPGATS